MHEELVPWARNAKAISQKFVIGVLLLTSVLSAKTMQAVEVDTDKPLSVMQAVADDWNHGRPPSSAYCESSLTVVDNTPPYLFQGPDAVKNWIDAYRKSQPKGDEESPPSLHFLKPKVIETTGSRAYIAVPAEWIIQHNGQSEDSRGMITAILLRRPQKWSIAAWIWTPQ